MEKMPEISLQHTLSSHGRKLAKNHKCDWVILLILILIDAGLNAIEPFHRFIGEGMMEDLKFPFKRQDTIPFWAVPVIAVVFPILVFTAFYFKRRDVHDLHHAVLGNFYAVLITGIITDSIKDAVGRPRPNFFYRCFPDGIAVFDITKQGDVLCSGDPAEIKEGYKSFPSGHSSWSFAGLGFLAWYITGKIRVFDQRGHVAKLCLTLLPLLVAALIAVSRVDDYWHHWQDVFAGGFLGLVVASFTYLQFFPLPSGEQGWGPHAYFKALASSHREGSEDEIKQFHSSEEDMDELENGRRV